MQPAGGYLGSVSIGFLLCDDEIGEMSEELPCKRIFQGIQKESFKGKPLHNSNSSRHIPFYSRPKHEPE